MSSCGGEEGTPMRVRGSLTWAVRRALVGELFSWRARNDERM